MKQWFRDKREPLELLVFGLLLLGALDIVHPETVSAWDIAGEAAQQVASVSDEEGRSIVRAH